MSIENSTIDAKPGFSQRVLDRLPTLAMIWFILTVLAPHQELYKNFFHLVVVPATLILIATRKAPINWNDPLLWVVFGFTAYASVATFFVGAGPISHHLDALRWGVEVCFGVLALYFWLQDMVQKPEWWGRFFLALALLGSLGGLIIFGIFQGFGGRLSGLGALHNPVQASAILTVYFALGHFLLSREVKLTRNDHLLLFSALGATAIAVLLSGSRAPIAALAAYCLFIGLVHFVQSPGKAMAVLIGALGVAVIVGVVIGLYGFEEFVQFMLERGFSYRLDIWQGYLAYPPDSWLLGFGAGTHPENMPAADNFWTPNNIPVFHPHSLYIGTLIETGLIGLLCLMTIFALIMSAVLKRSCRAEEKWRLFGILGLIVVLTLTSSHTAISSIKAIWLYFWLPMLFIWFWSHAPASPSSGKANTEFMRL